MSNRVKITFSRDIWCQRYHFALVFVNISFVTLFYFSLLPVSFKLLLVRIG